MDRHTVPDGNTFGWNSGGVNLPAGVSAGLAASRCPGPTFRGLGRVFLREVHAQLVDAALPGGLEQRQHTVSVLDAAAYLSLAGDAHLPHEQVERPVGLLLWARVKALERSVGSTAAPGLGATHERMVLAPLLALLLQPARWSARGRARVPGRRTSDDRYRTWRRHTSSWHTATLGRCDGRRMATSRASWRGAWHLSARSTSRKSETQLHSGYEH